MVSWLIISASHPSPYKSSPSRHDHEHETQAVIVDGSQLCHKLSSAASYPKIQPTEENDDSSRSRRRSVTSHPSPKSFSRGEDYGHENRPGRRSIVLSPTKLSFLASYPNLKIDPMQKNDNSRTRRHSVVTPLTTELSHPDPSLKQRLSSHPFHKSSPRRDDHDHEGRPSHRRQSIVLSPTRRSFTASKIDPIQPVQKDNDSPHKRRSPIVLPLWRLAYPKWSRYLLANDDSLPLLLFTIQFTTQLPLINVGRFSISSEQDPPASFIRTRVLFTSRNQSTYQIHIPLSWFWFYRTCSTSFIRRLYTILQRIWVCFYARHRGGKLSSTHVRETTSPTWHKRGGFTRQCCPCGFFCVGTEVSDDHSNL